ncbi:hypothetical protein Scep_017452 [Stephania cephalantha]|uniref:Uncharacterized protein n=1 Tax=Stephania cephalantha TaxID=152367 RepID=A0AAP0IPL7_9MAGN
MFASSHHHQSSSPLTANSQRLPPPRESPLSVVPPTAASLSCAFHRHRCSQLSPLRQWQPPTSPTSPTAFCSHQLYLPPLFPATSGLLLPRVPPRREKDLTTLVGSPPLPPSLEKNLLKVDEMFRGTLWFGATSVGISGRPHREKRTFFRVEWFCEELLFKFWCGGMKVDWKVRILGEIVLEERTVAVKPKGLLMWRE